MSRRLQARDRAELRGRSTPTRDARGLAAKYVNRSANGRFAATCLVIASLVPIGACKAPAKPHPSGPGITDEARAARVEQRPQVDQHAEGSSLSAEQRGIVLARIGDKTITLGDLEARLAREAPVVRAQYMSVPKRKEFLANWVHFEVLAGEARRLGYDQAPDVVEATRQVMVRRYLEEAVAEHVKAEDIGEAELRAYYDGHPELYHKPDQVQVRHMRFDDEAAARKIGDELVRGSDDSTARLMQLWNDYVGRHSKDRRTVPYLGSLGLVSLEPTTGTSDVEQARMAAIPRAVIEAAMALEPYKLSPPVQSDQGWHLLLVTSKSPAIDSPFESVVESIRGRLVKERRDDRRERLVDEVRARTHVEVNDDAVRLIEIQMPTPRQSRDKTAPPPVAATPTNSP